MSPASAKTSVPSASQVFTYTKGAALTSAPRALRQWRIPWSVEVCETTQMCKKMNEKKGQKRRVNNSCLNLHTHTHLYTLVVDVLILNLESKQFNWDHTQRGYGTPVKLLHPVLKLDLESLSGL